MAENMYSTLSLLFIVISSPCLAIYTISDYRLITKDRPNAGIVEVFNQDIGWGLVCKTDFNFELASIACRHLNFPGTSRHLTAVQFNDNRDEWPMSVTNNISTYFTRCSINGPNMQCETFITECINVWTGAVSCKEPGYLGCFSDYDRLGPGRDRVLSDGPREYDYILTIDLCIKACKEDGYFYAGVEDEDQCFCGGQDENLVKHGNASDGECKGVCAGDRLESCGYSDFIGIYQVGLGVCEDPGTPQNGFRYKETGSLRYGSKIYFNCSDEFTLEGPDVIQCVQMYGRREDVSIAHSTHAVMWNQSLPKCTGFSSTTPSSATTKGGGQTNQIQFSGKTGPDQQSGHQVIIIYSSIGIVSGLLLITIAMIVVVVIRKRRKRKAECLDPTTPGIGQASSNHGNGGGSPLMPRGDGEGDLFVLADLTAHSQTAGENNYVDDNERQPPTYPGAMDRPGITRDAFGYESVRLPSADSALNGSGGIPGEVPVDGAIDLYANTEFHDVPTNLIDNELYG
eukprot:XP_011661704.1 PREDICTED: uncharacterized protein LOC105437134 isoform X2 [Strongylocentrotus purpuratus]